jgi:protein SCO1
MKIITVGRVVGRRVVGRNLSCGLPSALPIALLLASTAFAQTRPTEPGLPAAALPAALVEVGFDQHLNQPLPLDTEFSDETGRRVHLREYFGQRPVVLAFVYYGCPMLCVQSLSSLASTLGVLSEGVGTDFEVISISIDPRETPLLARDKKAHYVERSGKASIARGWHYLTGTEDEIRRLTNAAGFRYVWDEKLQQYAHPAGIVVATERGTVSRYLFGIDYGPRDLRLAALDASQGKIGSPLAKAVLYCYRYDVSRGRYSLAILRIVQLAGIATVFSLGTLIVVWTRRERKQAG